MKRLLLLLLVVTLFFPFDVPRASAATVCDDYGAGLVAHWKMEEVSGTRVSATSTNDLTDNNTVAQATGKIGDAAGFAAASSEYLSITDASQSGLDLGSKASFSFWFYHTSDPAASDYYSFVSKDNASTQRSYGTYYYNNAGNKQLWFYAFGTLTATAFSYSWTTLNLATSAWHNIIISFDGSGSLYSDKIKIFLNGAATTPATGGNVGGGATSIANGTAPFYVGRTDDGTKYLNGRMDEVSVYNGVALTLADAQAIYNSGAGIDYDCAGGGEPEATTTPIIPISGDVTASGDVIMSR